MKHQASSWMTTARLWRNLRETNSRAVKGAIHRSLAEQARSQRPSLGEQLMASGAIWDQPS